jgi:hypothetical protein
MKIVLLISLLLACPSVALAADDAQCDAKPFTLDKPKAAAKQQPAASAIAEDKKPKPVPKAPLKANAKQAKPKPIADCKEPRKG